MKKVSEVTNRLIPGKHLNEIGVNYTQAIYFMGWVDAIVSLKSVDKFDKKDLNIEFTEFLAKKIANKYHAKFEALLCIMVSTEGVIFVRNLIKK